MVGRLQKKTKLVYGVGINDADYPVHPKIDGKAVRCPYYTTWRNMLERCYSQKSLEYRPSYKGCSVCPDWIYFMNFRAWMMKQDWEGKELDKDLLVRGNKVYSPETCMFINRGVNIFLVEKESARGDYMLGVYYEKSRGKFRACCSNPFTGKMDKIGRFNTEKEAHEAWRQYKHKLACILADLQTDARVANALRSRYAESFLIG